MKFIITLILEKLLGGNMEKMMTNNNGLTALNTILLIITTYLCYINYEANQVQDRKIDAINTAWFYKFGTTPFEPPRGHSSKSKHYAMHPDMMFNKEEQQEVQKDIETK